MAENCAVCSKKLTFFNTNLVMKKDGGKVCTSCAQKMINEKMAPVQEAGQKMSRLSGKFGMMILIGVLGIVGLVTLPLGLIFWLIDIFLITRLFKK